MIHKIYTIWRETRGSVPEADAMTITPRRLNPVFYVNLFLSQQKKIRLAIVGA
jgi:hypothetical protein